MTEQTNKHNTIFDDVFRTMIQKMPKLLIPVINEAFGTDYDVNIPFEQLRNEHVEIFGKVITDSIIRIESHIYHMECQSTNDSTMVLRMIEYDFAIALEDAFLQGKPYEINFPESCVLYLRKGNEIKRTLKIKVNLPDGQNFIYNAKAINLQNYTCDDIFERKLLFFLPYYIMRYEDELPFIYQDENKIKTIFLEYEEIRKKLEKELNNDDKSILYTDLIKLINTIADYIIKSDEIRKGLKDIMGGQILELESERLIRIGREEGLVKGLAEGELIAYFKLVQDKTLTLPIAAQKANISEEEFLDAMKKAGY